MKNLSLIICIVVVSLITGCSSTSKVAVHKKPLVSDHMLMMSLLNRPITQDQQMMLAFAKQRESYQNPYFVNAVQIKGSKESDKSAPQTNHVYSRLIAQDFNSVRISGPK